MPNVGVIYDVATKAIRWIHVPDRPGDEAVGVNLLPDEAIVVLPRADLPTLQAAVQGL